MSYFVSFDMETSSLSPLETVGAPRYIRDVSTRALMFAYHVYGDQAWPKLWCEGDPLPEDFVHHVHNGATFTGWNVIGFDRLGYRRLLVERHGFPAIADERWQDSMQSAAAANLPRSLDACAKALGVTFTVDLKDKARIKRVTNAAKTPIPATIRQILTYPGQFDSSLVDDIRWLADRCVQDVVLEEQNFARLPAWPQVRPWLNMPHIDRRINDRGVLMDRALVEGMATAAEFEKSRLSREISKLTNGQVPAVTNIERLKVWLLGNGVQIPLKADKQKKNELDGDDHLQSDEDEDSSEKGSLYRLRKSDIADILARPDVPDFCREALAIRSEAAKSSVAKLHKMSVMAGLDDRLNGIFIMGGAQQTLRFCLAEGTPILTRDIDYIISEKPIEDVTVNDEVWDGDSWVKHDGVVFSGIKLVLTYDGVTATGEHEVFTSETVKISLTQAIAGNARLFGGRRNPYLYGLLPGIAQRQTLYRANQDRSGCSMVAACECGEAEQNAAADIGRYSSIRPRVISNGDNSREPYADRSGVSGKGNDTRSSDNGSQTWLQSDGRRRRSPSGSGSVFLAGDKKEPRTVCGVPEETQRWSEEWRPDAAHSSFAGCGCRMEKAEPGQNVRAGNAGFGRSQEMAGSPSGEEIPTTLLGSSTPRIGAQPRSKLYGNCCSVGWLQHRTARGCNQGNIGFAQKLPSIFDGRKEGSAHSPDQSCSQERRRNQTQSATEGSLGGLLDAATESRESRGNEAGTRKAPRYARTYDILNAGPKNRFLAAGKLVSNSSGGPQFHNLTRDVFANMDEVADAHKLDAKKDAERVKALAVVMLRTAIEAGHTGDANLLRAMYEAPKKDAQGRIQIVGVLTWISRMMRRTLGAAKGHVLLNGDFAQVEARITAWLAQQLDVLETYRSGGDVYRQTASGIYNILAELITKMQRQAGKVAVLACGFGGGPHALLAMAYNMGLLLSMEEAVMIVKGWRKTNAATVAYWYATDDAAANAVRYPGREFPVAPLGAVSYFMLDDCLCCRLPSGRLLRYWQPRLHQDYWEDGSPKERLSLTGIAIKGKAVFRRSLYHTILVENQVQAIGADFLGFGLENVDRNGIPIVLHVHDNIAAESPENRADRDLIIFKQAMLDMPSWIGNLPMGVDADYSPRFG